MHPSVPGRRLAEEAQRLVAGGRARFWRRRLPWLRAHWPGNPARQVILGNYREKIVPHRCVWVLLSRLSSSPPPSSPPSRPSYHLPSRPHSHSFRMTRALFTGGNVCVYACLRALCKEKHLRLRFFQCLFSSAAFDRRTREFVGLCYSLPFDLFYSFLESLLSLSSPFVFCSNKTDPILGHSRTSR